MHQPVEQLLGDRAPVDVADARGVESLRLVADRPTVGSALDLGERGGGTEDGEDEDGAEGEGRPDGEAEAPPSGAAFRPPGDETS